MNTNQLLNVASRKRIYECTVENPGAHLRDIARRTSLPLGTTLYHLDALESGGMVVTRRDGRYKRYFVDAAMDREEKALMSAMRHDAPRRIIHALLLNGPSTQRELCEATRLSRSTLSFHLCGLLRQGLALREELRPEARHDLIARDTARRLLTRYAESLGANATAEFLSLEALAPPTVSLTPTSSNFATASG